MKWLIIINLSGRWTSFTSTSKEGEKKNHSLKIVLSSAENKENRRNGSEKLWKLNRVFVQTSTRSVGESRANAAVSYVDRVSDKLRWIFKRRKRETSSPAVQTHIHTHSQCGDDPRQRHNSYLRPKNMILMTSNTHVRMFEATFAYGLVSHCTSGYQTAQNLHTVETREERRQHIYPSIDLSNSESGKWQT